MMGKAKKRRGRKPTVGRPSKADVALLLIDLIKEIIKIAKRYGPDFIRYLRAAIEHWKTREAKKSTKAKRTRKPKHTGRPLKQLEKRVGELKGKPARK